MSIKLNILLVESLKSVDIDIDSSSLVSAIKTMISEQNEHHVITNQRLFFNKVQLNDSKPISSYNLQNNDKLFLVKEIRM